MCPARPFIACLLTAIFCIPCAAFSADLADLGRALFFDTRLSNPPGQACATCHDPGRAFTDSRRNASGGALSLGADGHSFADRNTPTLTYAAFIPEPRLVSGHHQGGLFLDGRVETLFDQVVEPLLNPLEMGLADEAALAARVLALPDYRKTFDDLFGEQVFEDPHRLVAAISTAIDAFEHSPAFSTFDSRYDRFLAGDYQMTRDEAMGRELFFSDLINCVQCHVNRPGRVSPRETFTNHRYHNIGVPTNLAARQANGLDPAHEDPGLAGRLPGQPAAERGKFRVPTLRNVAVTAPYMHNGVFETLEAAVAFYGKYTLTNRRSRINPDTQRDWRAPEVPATVDRQILSQGQPIDARRTAQLVAFLKTLTDRRYEGLLFGVILPRNRPALPQSETAAPD